MIAASGSNAKQIEISRLRTVSLNDQESPVARIQAARKLLQDHGATQRSLPIIRTVINLFVSSSDADVQERALKLRARLANILELKKVKLPKELENDPIEISEDSTNPEAIAHELEPKRPLTEREEYLQEIVAKKPKPIERHDEFDSNFVNVAEAVSRVVVKYGDSKPPYTDLQNDRLLETFLGESIPLSAYSANQIWQALAREYKLRGGSLEKTFTSLFPPHAVWVQTALCSYVNRHHVSVPMPNCLSVTDDFGSRG